MHGWAQLWLMVRSIGNVFAPDSERREAVKSLKTDFRMHGDELLRLVTHRNSTRLW